MMIIIIIVHRKITHKWYMVCDTIHEVYVKEWIRLFLGPSVQNNNKESIRRL